MRNDVKTTYIVENMWTHNQFETSSYFEAMFFANMPDEYVVVERVSMKHIMI